MMVLGSVLITRAVDEGGREVVTVDYEGLTSYEAVGLLTVELDTQRAEMQRLRGEAQ